MVLINETPVRQGDQYVTAYEAEATTGQVEYTFPELQATLTIFNFGLRGVIAVANGERKVIDPNDSETFKHTSSVTIHTLVGAQRFRLEGRKQVEQIVAGTVDTVARESAAESLNKMGVLTKDLEERAVNVRQSPYNAKGDGIADDTAAIQAAIDTGKPVFIPSGIYKLSMTGKTEGQFALTSFGKYQIISGSGIGETILKLDGTASISLQVLGMDNGTLCNMSIDGGFSPASKQANLSSCVQTNSNSIVENCHIYNAQGSCLVSVGENVLWRKNRLEKFGDHALYVAGNLDGSGNILQHARKITMEGNICVEDNTYQNGVAGGQDRGVIKLRDNVYDTVIANNIIEGDMCVLLSSSAQFQKSIIYNVTISGNTMITKYAGVMVETLTSVDNGYRTEKVTISANTVNGVNKTGNGVILKSSKSIIVGNSFLDVNAGVTNQESGDVGNSLISGNLFRNANTGIYKAGLYTLITGNSFENCTTQAIYDVYKNVLKGNTIKGCASGLIIATSYSATDFAEYSTNTFITNTTGVTFKDTSNSYTFFGNVFVNNTTSAVVENGGRLNNNLVYNNQILSGTAFPSSGVNDSVVVAPTQPILKVTTLPTASAAFRGKTVRVDGSTGVADSLYMCMKSATDTYSWKPVATG